jgi:hypothetical protein
MLTNADAERAGLRAAALRRRNPCHFPPRHLHQRHVHGALEGREQEGGGDADCKGGQGAAGGRLEQQPRTQRLDGFPRERRLGWQR